MVAQLRHYATRWKVGGFDFHWCHWNFSLTSIWPHYGPGVDSNRNEYQEYLMGLEGGRQPYHLCVPTVSKSGSLSLLEPSGPVIGLYRDCLNFYIQDHLCDTDMPRVYCEAGYEAVNINQTNLNVQSAECCYVITAARSQVDKTEIW